MNTNIAPIRPNYDEPNYDVDKITPYILEDPLCFADGTPLKSAADWPARRKEILDIFAHEMYGVEPPAPKDLIIDIFEEKNDALAGFAVRTQYKMYFKKIRVVVGADPCIQPSCRKQSFLQEKVASVRMTDEVSIHHSSDFSKRREQAPALHHTGRRGRRPLLLCFN